MKPLIRYCSQCGKKNRIVATSKKLKPLCGSCGSPLFESNLPRNPSNPLSAILTAVALAGAIYGITATPAFLKKDFSDLEQSEAAETAAQEAEIKARISSKTKEYENAIVPVNSEDLRAAAVERYEREYLNRGSLDSRFALSPREQTLLEMQGLASDSTKSLHDVIKSVAQRASPFGSEIRVTQSGNKLELHVDFDMSSMTSGEHGTRTKHDTIKSLKDEVRTLISRAANDIFQFCGALNLDSIYVGCRHMVISYRNSLRVGEENALLYKVKLNRSQLGELTSNPYLEEYSTTRYLEIEEDNFHEIRIDTSYDRF